MAMMGGFGGFGGGGRWGGKGGDNWNGSMKPVQGLDAATKDEVEEFFAEHPSLDDKAKDRLRSLHGKLQRLIINKGSMADTNSPSLVLMQRCKSANTMKPDDWICQACWNIVFAK